MTQQTTTQVEWTRVNSDQYGNPRYVVHFTDYERLAGLDPDYSKDLSTRYANTVKHAHKLNGRKFHNKQYGGGILFCTYEPLDVEKSIIEHAN